MKTKILGLLALGLVAGLVARAGSAASLVGACSPYSETSSNAFGPMQCDSFDSSLGTLTGITYSFTGSYSGSFVLVNFGTAAATFDGGVARIEGVVQGPDVFAILDRTVDIPSVTLNPGQTSTTGFNLTVTQTGSVPPGTSYLLYLDPFGVDFEAYGFPFLPPDKGCESFATSVICLGFDDPVLTYAFSGFLTYTYDSLAPPVPEPGTLALLGLGLAGLGLSRRRKAN